MYVIFEETDSAGLSIYSIKTELDVVWFDASCKSLRHDKCSAARCAIDTMSGTKSKIFQVFISLRFSFLALQS